MTQYLITEEKYGRSETRPDFAALARDLAPLLGGKFVQPEDREWWSGIEVDGMMLQICASQQGQHSDRRKVVVDANPIGIRHDDRPTVYAGSSYSEKFRLPQATVSVERPLAAIAKDIKRRVIDAAKAPLAEIAAYAAERQNSRDSLSMAVHAAKAAFPGAEESKNFPRDTHHCRLWLPNFSPIDVYADGDVHLERLPNVSLETAKAIIALIKADRKGV